jgi:hypothetical protein
MLKQINYKGVSRIPSDNASFDGELEECYNLANSNGELRPVVKPVSIGNTAHQFLFVHKNGYEHFICLNGADVTAYDFSNGSLSLIGIITNIYGEDLIKFEAVGNTLIIITSLSIKYALWKNSQYNFLGSDIPFPVINFSLLDREGISKTLDASAYPEDINKITPSGVNLYVNNVFSDEFNTFIKGEINSNISYYTDAGYHLFPFFIRYAVRLFDGSLVKHSMPFLMLPTRFMPFQIGFKGTPYTTMYLFFQNVSRLVLSHAAIDLSLWSDIIQSVDIFMSDYIYTYLYDGVINGTMPNPLYNSSDVRTPIVSLNGIFKSNQHTIDDISSTGNFYFVGSISIDELKSSVSQQEFAIDNIGALLNQELMTDDYHTHDSITAENSFVYNNKLHLSGITTKPFDGFSVYDKTFYRLTNKDASIYVGPQPFIFYPGKCDTVNLYSYTTIDGNPATRMRVLNLSQHKYLNGSFYLSPSLTNIGPDSVLYFHLDPKLTFSPRPLDVNNDKIFVSAHQNPFYFPVGQRITLPVGKIVAMASNTRALSSGQFGQFPLYVFTDDGIWALEMQSDGTYIARQPVSREVAVSRNILQMDTALGFITDKGLSILSGADIECISSIISDVNTRSSKLNITSLANVSGMTEMQSIYNTIDVETYMKNAFLSYEYLNRDGRIFCMNPSYSYAYVFDIQSRSWSKVFSDYVRSVNNYPDSYVQSSDGTIRNLSSINRDTSPVKSFIVSRPVKLDDALFWLRHLIHRRIGKSTLNTVIYASRNGIDYAVIGSSRKDIMRFGGSPFRYYKIVVQASLNPDEVLCGMDIEIEPKFNNRLR